jgi:hypothetical protein
MMSDFSVENIVWTQVLKEAFGESVELEDDKGHIEVYDIAAEFEDDEEWENVSELYDELTFPEGDED